MTRTLNPELRRDEDADLPDILDGEGHARPMRFGRLAAFGAALPIVAVPVVPMWEYVAFTALCGLALIGLAVQLYRADRDERTRSHSHLLVAETDGHRTQHAPLDLTRRGHAALPMTDPDLTLRRERRCA